MAAKGSGRTSRNFQRLAANLRARRDPCWLCGQAIDYTLDRSHPDSFTADHEKPLSTHPHLAEEPSNLRAAHRRCNSARGSSSPRPMLGTTSRQW